MCKNRNTYLQGVPDYIVRFQLLQDCLNLLILTLLFQDIKDIKKLEKEPDNIKIGDELARGEFGIVYKGKLVEFMFGSFHFNNFVFLVI